MLKKGNKLVLYVVTKPRGPVPDLSLISLYEAPSTLIRFQTKTELFWSGYGYLHTTTPKRSHSKTLSRVERIENDAFRKRCFLVWTEKTMLSQNGDVNREYPKWRTDATMWLQFRTNFVGRYIKMRMRRVHLGIRTEGIKAFSKRIRRCSVNGRSVDANLFENGAKQLRFRLKTD